MTKTTLDHQAAKKWRRSARVADIYPWRMRSKPVIVALLVLWGSAATAASAPLEAAQPTKRFVALYADGVTNVAARRALAEVGARIIKENRAIGLATVAAPASTFVDDAMATGAFYGIATDRSIGVAAPDAPPRTPDNPRHERTVRPSETSARAHRGDPLFRYQWNMRMIHATPRGSYAKERGDEDVLVGVMDTGIDARNPDLRRNVDKRLSRSFLGTLSEERDECKGHPDTRYCGNSPLTDTLGHGTSVGSAIAGSINHFGMSGVAPRVTLVSLRISREYVFVQPVVDALTYAAKHGVDIVNMSFFVDPWLFNCPDNPADSDEQQMEQRTIVKAVQGAVDFAVGRDVTPIAALGNEGIDLGKPKVDTISPDYPPGKAYRRDVDNSCLVIPPETDGVIGVSALGPSKRKAYYSEYGVERTDVSAPGGDDYDPARPYPRNGVLLATSKISLAKEGKIDEDGKPLTGAIIRRCRRPQHRRCGYYEYTQGTSFASPTAAGVAALIVSRAGTQDHRGLTMDPAKVESLLLSTATPHRCPKGRVQRYPRLNAKYRAKCEGPRRRNGFYGAGIVDALRAARRS